MKLNEVIKDLSSPAIRGELNKEIKEICYDSRKIKDNSIFICIEGFEDDGHRYIEQAIEGGAAAVIIEKELNYYEDDITYIRVKNSRKAMAKIAAVFFNYPLSEISLLGVTGTNGKTTTTYLIKSILEKAGYKTGLIGTIKNIINNQSLPSVRTTPESLDLYRIFRQMADNDVDYAVMEVSSHALDLNRVHNMDFRAAVFTNISQDHLDYHKSIEDYLAAKSLLFKQLGNKGAAVINIDDSKSDKIIEVVKGKILSYGIFNNADIMAAEINLTPQETEFMVPGKGKINMKLSGRFNVYNALAAIGVGISLKIPFSEIKVGLEEIEGVPGRFESIDCGQDFSVIVDYAHTPDGLENVLTTVHEFVDGKIIAVFGCGGDRDRDKRPKMGKIAAHYADYCILTSDNPRSEDPFNILKEIENGIINDNILKPYSVIPDRKEAIFQAVEKANSSDVVIIFGKGHETYQIFKNKTIHFDDREEVREALALFKKGELHAALKDLRNRKSYQWENY